MLTGLSATGKSTLVEALAARGHRAVDLDTDEYSAWVDIAGDDGVQPGRDWVWREERVNALLDVHGDLIAAGCAANMTTLVPRFDHVVLLTVPRDVMALRLAERTTNDYGKRPGEAERALGLIETIEPLLRRIATVEVDTAAALAEVVAEIELQIRHGPS